jgi:hypothetical protein
MQAEIKVGYQAFVSDGGDEFGAVREIFPESVVVYVENAGDFVIPRTAVEAVHAQKVVFSCDKLAAPLRQAIGHAHDAEDQPTQPR